MWYLVGDGIAGQVIAVLLGRKLAQRSNQSAFSWIADSIAGMAGCAAVVIGTGLVVGNKSDVPTVLARDPAWKSFLQFIWYHPLVMALIGSIAGVVALRSFERVLTKTHRT